MLHFNPYNLLAGLVFGAVGWGAWRYGKAVEKWQFIAIGLALMVYPYFIWNDYAVWIVGAGLCGMLWYCKD